MSVRKPQVRLEYGDNVNQPQSVLLRGFIEESMGFEKVNNLKALLMQDIASYLSKRESKPAAP